MRRFVDNINRCLVQANASIGEVAKAIDQAALQIALLVDADRRLVATITDGDIRRAMLAGIGFDQPVSRLLEVKNRSDHPKPITRPIDASDDALLQAMQAAHIEHIPLLDAEKRVVDLALLRKLTGVMTDPGIQAMVMAGGMGTRLRPLTNNTPKPMLPVGDKPLLERTIEQLRVSGITEINIATHYLQEQIEGYFGSGDQFGVKVNYVQEETPLGTAGALSLLERPKQTVLVINGDILTTIDFRAMAEFHRSHKADVTVAVRLYEMDVPFGVVDCDGARITSMREKPRYQFFVNAGVYLVEPSALDFIATSEHLDMPQMIERVIAAGGNAASFPVREYWLDIGRPDDYRRAQADFSSGKV